VEAAGNALREPGEALYFKNIEIGGLVKKSFESQGRIL